MKSKLQNNQKGFTIIEVLIVLAIAGLILLIVFLAVPALQRNSRNTQRKNDVAAVLGAVNEWSSNNNGRLPSTTAEQTAAIANVQLGFYNGNVVWDTSWPVVVSGSYNDQIHIAVGNRCNGETAIAQTPRAVAVLFYLESGSAPTQQCEGS